AHSLNNLAFLLQARGEHARAEPLFREALDMRRALFPRHKFPDGHPDLALSLNNLASLLQARGEYARTEPLFREALDMRTALDQRFAAAAAIADALNLVAPLPLTRDGYLSLPAERTEAAVVYAALWRARAALSRVEGRRHRD